MSQEPVNADNPLLQAKNIVITPHIAWAPKEARMRLYNVSVENIKGYIDDKCINIVNGVK